MPEFKVRGESTVQWEVIIEADDAESAERMTSDLIEGSLTVELDMGPEVGAEITGQQDKLQRVQEISGKPRRPS